MISVPFCSLKYSHDQIKTDIEKAIDTVYRRNQFILGTEVAAFEKEYADFNGTRYAVGVANGLDALFLSLQLCGVEPDDEVIVPAHTYIATWLAISRLGARIVPVDVDPTTMLLSTELISHAVTARTKVILPVHLYGAVCEMPKLLAIAKEHGLKVIEDNAQAHGAKYDGQLAGSFGDCNATSFYPTKNLGALGDAGAITTDNEEYYKKALVLRNYGTSEQFINPVQGINSRLDELQAAVLRIKLHHLNDWNLKRKKLAEFYSTALKGIGDIILPNQMENSSHVFHLYVIRTNHREELRSYLFKKGIGTMIHYPVPPHLQEAYKTNGFKKGDFPVAENLAQTVLSLPMWPGLELAQIEWVVKQINNFYQDK